MVNSSPTENQIALSEPKVPVNISILYSALDNYGGYPFLELFDGFMPVYHPDDILDKNGVLVVWGGADISPGLYGQMPGKHTGATKDPSHKDQLELNLIGRAIKMGMPILGICRGAQMLCAMAGGTLIQDVSGHHATHSIKTDEGKVLSTSSVHHQMMFPWTTDHKLIAWAHPPRSEHYFGEPSADVAEDVMVTLPEGVDPDKREPEIVYFPGLKALAIQGHPEFIHNEKHEFVQYSKKLVIQYLLKPFVKGSKDD